MGDYPFFPVFVDLSGKRILVFGAGKIAHRRISVLCQFTPELAVPSLLALLASAAVIAPDCLPEVEELAKEGRIRLIKKPYEESDLEGADFVLAATNDHAVNDLIYEACKKRNITVNVSTDRSKSDFYFPGIARKGNIVVGVTASGKDHAGAGRVSELMREMLEKI